jgi:hypothetical protein
MVSVIASPSGSMERARFIRPRAFVLLPEPSSHLACLTRSSTRVRLPVTISLLAEDQPDDRRRHPNPAGTNRSMRTCPIAGRRSSPRSNLSQAWKGLMTFLQPPGGTLREGCRRDRRRMTQNNPACLPGSGTIHWSNILHGKRVPPSPAPGC